MNYCKTIVSGRLVRDLELKSAKNGTLYTKGTIAFNDPYDKDSATFLDFTLFGKRAEALVEKVDVSKGDPLMVEGRLKTDRWETRDGDKREKITLLAESFTLVPRAGREQGGRAKQKTAYETDEDPFTPEVDDTPF